MQRHHPKHVPDAANDLGGLAGGEQLPREV
jgi:hypothetical protein